VYRAGGCVFSCVAAERWEGGLTTSNKRQELGGGGV
jgi:hypothetical protein